MAHYGFDYDSPGRRGVGYIRYTVRGYGPPAPLGEEELSQRQEGSGWSRPEFGTFPGDVARRGLAGSPSPWWARDWDEPGSAPQAGWRAGQPWGSASDADRVRARDIMTENPEAVTPDTTLTEVARKMRDLDVGIMPVVDDVESGRIQGVITDRDIAVRAAADGKDMKKARVADFMSAGAETVRESDSVREVFNVMKRARVRRVPVADENGRLVGIIAQADLAVDYAGLDLDREMEVEEVIERISEPARPRRFREAWPSGFRGYEAAGYDRPDYHAGYDRDFGDRIRQGWRSLRRGARGLMHRGYDRDWR
jgi:CBS domain-containing protein